jgi:hypothetical protein
MVLSNCDEDGRQGSSPSEPLVGLLLILEGVEKAIILTLGWLYNVSMPPPRAPVEAEAADRLDAVGAVKTRRGGGKTLSGRGFSILAAGILITASQSIRWTRTCSRWRIARKSSRIFHFVVPQSISIGVFICRSRATKQATKPAAGWVVFRVRNNVARR